MAVIFDPDYATPPGETLADLLEEKNISTIRGLSTATVEQIIKNQRRITRPIARRLEQELGVPEHVWMNLEDNYQKDRARQLAASVRNFVCSILFSRIFLLGIVWALIFSPVIAVWLIVTVFALPSVYYLVLLGPILVAFYAGHMVGKYGA
jgi:plasmid maintenance system antidote protein VapI